FASAETGWSGRELFHLKIDPRDLHNVLGKNRPVADLLAAEYDAFEKNSKKYSGTALKIDANKKKLEELRTLGYMR
ncbi:MAG: hypothetical protein ACYDH3_05730, partial [Candidatus Aminicenantales bacterium]